MDARELLLGRSPNAAERMDARELHLPPQQRGKVRDGGFILLETSVDASLLE